MNTYQGSILPNGLKIITSENQHSEIVSISLWVLAGSRYEAENQKGYAHLLEHMLTKGTKKYPSVFDVNVQKDRAGALSNALTGPERIYVFIQTAKSHLPKMFELLAEMILNPLFEENVLENEKKIVIQELRRGRNDYSKLLWISSLKKIFEGHPLSHHPLDAANIEAINSADSAALKKYHQRFFIPNRAALIVSGGAKHHEILDLANKFFGQWEKTANVFDSPRTPKIKTGRFFEKAEIEQFRLAFNYVAPKIGLEDSAAFEILKNYLTYGHSSLLSGELRHKSGLIYNVAANNYSFQDANLFYIETSSTKPSEVISALPPLIENLERHFNEQTFNELKNQTINIFLRKINDPLADAAFLGSFWVLTGHLVSPEEWIKMIKSVSYADLMNVKNKYFSASNLFITAIGSVDFF